jgi:hypothetical protein
MSLTEVREGQAQSLVKPKVVAPPVVNTSKVVTPSKTILPSKFDLIRQKAEQQVKNQTQLIQPLPSPSESYRPPPGITVTEKNGERTTRVTLRPGESSNLRWTGESFGGTITTQNKTEGIEPARKMTSGEIISNRFTQPGHDIFYGKQKGPEQVFSTAGDVKLTRGPSTKAIMVEVGSTIGVALPLGAVTKISMGAAQTLINPNTGKAIGVLGKVYKYGVKPAFIGVGLTGAGIQAGYTAAQFNAGKTTIRQISVDVLNTGAALASFGLTGGIPDNMWSKFKTRTPGDILTNNNRIIGRINKANKLGMRTGNIETNYNNIRIGRPGELLSSDKINVRQNILDVKGNKIGEQFIQGVESDFIQGTNKAELYIDFPGSESKIFNKEFSMYSVGGSEALNKIIPGIENPVQTDAFTTMKYKTGEIQGIIKTGKIIKYTKLSPEFNPYVDNPYVDNTPWRFKKTPLKFTKASDIINTNKPEIKLASNIYKGGSKTIGTSSGGLISEQQRPMSNFERSLIRSEIEQTPVFNVYPPSSKMTMRIGPTITPVTSIKTTTQTQADYAGVMNKRLTSLGYKKETKTDRIQISNRDTAKRNIARASLFGTGLFIGLTPRQTTRTEQIQTTIKTTKTTQTLKNTFTNPFDIKSENIMTRTPYIPMFPFSNIQGGGEGGRGSDDWNRYFRKRKFNIGSINQAFGIGMKPMKLIGMKI